MGIRLALGASRTRVLRGVMASGLRLVALGTVVGLLASMAASGILVSMLFQVAPTDPGTYVAVASLTAAVALLACYLPARRAASVDPVVSLQQE